MSTFGLVPPRVIYSVYVVVLTLTHRYNAVRGRRTGSNNSGVEDFLTVEENE